MNQSLNSPAAPMPPQLSNEPLPASDDDFDHPETVIDKPRTITHVQHDLKIGDNAVVFDITIYDNQTLSTKRTEIGMGTTHLRGAMDGETARDVTNKLQAMHGSATSDPGPEQLSEDIIKNKTWQKGRSRGQ